MGHSGGGSRVGDRPLPRLVGEQTPFDAVEGRRNDTALDAGDYERAQRLALQTNEESSYPKLDSTLATLIDATRGTMRSYINQGIAASTFVSTMVLMLSLLSVFCLWLGIRPRLQEYL